MSFSLAAIPATRVMHTDFFVLDPDQSLAHAAARMTALDVRELPVAREGELLGILAVRDMEPFRGHFEWTHVREAMTPDPITVTPETRVGTVARLLLDRRFNCLPVAVGPALLGMIRRTDLLRLMIEEAGP